MISNRAVFAAYAGHLQGKGGVQLCTQEYITSLRATGLDLTVVPIQADRRLSTRIGRRVAGSPYFRPISARSIQDIQSAGQGAKFLFLNQVCLAGALPTAGIPSVPTVLLSHGCEVTDLLHIARLHKSLPISRGQLRPSPQWALGRTLSDEAQTRSHVSGVIAISPFDADSERWLGAPQVCWVPRTLTPHFLDRQPVLGRFGYVGTLDHAPNMEGLVLVAEELRTAGAEQIEIRVAGGPTRLGRWLADRYPFIHYAGTLDDAALRTEAASWNGFIHPIFCLARGCSTKLATALEWGLPIVTTPEGRRGYEWQAGALLETTTPGGFVGAMRTLMDADADIESARMARLVACSMPTTAHVASRISEFLALIKGTKVLGGSTRPIA